MAGLVSTHNIYNFIPSAKAIDEANGNKSGRREGGTASLERELKKAGASKDLISAAVKHFSASDMAPGLHQQKIQADGGLVKHLTAKDMLNSGKEYDSIKGWEGEDKKIPPAKPAAQPAEKAADKPAGKAADGAAEKADKPKAANNEGHKH